MRKVLLLVVFCTSITGCATNSLLMNYPAQIAPHKRALNSDLPQRNLIEITEEISSNDGLLYAQEAGRITQVSGDFSASQHYYQQAIDAYRALDDKAVISASSVGANASSLLLNDNVIPYSGSGYERILVHQYQAMNYLFQQDFQGALVEVRRANELQQIEQNKYANSDEASQALANGTLSREINRLSKAAGSVTSSFLNAYSYYVTGLLHETLGNPNDAFIDYRKAAQIWPSNHYVEQDLVRLAKQLGMPQYQEFKRRWGEAQLPQSNEGELIVIYETGFVPEKQSFTVPFTINGNWQTASLATYPFRLPQPTSVTISGLGDSALSAESITSIDALAVNALKEALPAALVRQTARIAAKAQLARKAQSRSEGEFDLGAIAVQLFNIITEQADLRSWLTLPSQAQIARQYIAAGHYPLKIGNSSPQNITITAGRKTFVWVINTGKITRLYSIII